MTSRKMILLTLAVLVPCGLLIVALRCLVKSSFVEEFLKDPQAEFVTNQSCRWKG
jgi:hypothetical protein